MKHIRVWIVFLFIALGIIAIRLSPQTQDGLRAFLSGYCLYPGSGIVVRDLSHLSRAQ